MLQFKTIKLVRSWKILRASITVTICGIVRVSEKIYVGMRVSITLAIITNVRKYVWLR